LVGFTLEALGPPKAKNREPRADDERRAESLEPTRTPNPEPRTPATLRDYNL
jgi:hypothetical protein